MDREAINEIETECDSNVKIANDVVGKIAAIAALEVEGVASMGNNITTELLNRVGVKNIGKNVRVEVLGHSVSLEVIITIEYGTNIPAISQKIQNRVKQAVENMTGLEVTEVSVRIAGVNPAKEGRA